MYKQLKILILCILNFLGVSVVSAQFENLNFEFGNFDNWVLDTGERTNLTFIDWNTRPASDLGLQIKLTSPSSPRFDKNALNCLPTPLNIPTVLPGGRFSARIGNLDGGNKVARLSHTFTVTPNATFLQYSYAIVLEDPGHRQREQPKFVVNIKDSKGNLIPCGKYEAFSGPNAAGKGFLNCGKYQILPWTTEGADLSAYIGEEITLEFLSLDCTLGQHGGYAYVDATLKTLEIKVEDFCNSDDTVILHAPLGFTEYVWSNGEETPSITVPNATYGQNFNMTAISNTGCLSTLFITLEPKPEATINPIPNMEVCLGGSILVEPTGENVGDFRYTRPDPTNPSEFIDIAPSGSSALLKPTQNTTYTIIARDKNGCDGPSTNLNVKVINSDGPSFPKADFEIETVATMDSNVCNTIQLKNLSDYCKGGLSYFWDFGDGTTSTETNPSHSFSVTNDTTTYIITLTVVSEDGLVESKALEYNAFISAKFSTAKIDCETVSISNLSNICDTTVDNFSNLIYHWDFGDGSPNVNTDNNKLSLSHIYTVSGNYNITLTITHVNNPAVAISTYTEPVDINLETNTDFNYIINCLDVTFEDVSNPCSTVENYLWDFGDGSSTSNEVSPRHTYTSSGTYIVTLTISDGDQDFTQNKEITVNTTETIPDFVFEINCDIVSFTNLSNSCDDLTYLWDFGDDTLLSNNKNPTHRYDLNKSYDVTLTINDGTKDYITTKTFTLGSGLNGYNTPQDIVLCTNPNMTTAPLFDLAAQKEYILKDLIANNLELPIISFHLTAPEAFNGLRALPLEYRNLTNPQRIYVRISNQNGCVEVYMISLIILNTPEVNSFEDIHLCYFEENTVGYDLTQLNGRVFENIDQDEVKLTYYLFEDDAIQGINSISEINLNAGLDIKVYVRSENISDSSCFNLNTFEIRMDNEDTDLNQRCLPFFSNTMTPNADGVNDTFFIKNIEKFPNNKLTIYNRWGNIVYKASGYNNTWDGTYKGCPLPIGNYYYFIELNDEAKRSHSGYITILR